MFFWSRFFWESSSCFSKISKTSWSFIEFFSQVSLLKISNTPFSISLFPTVILIGTHFNSRSLNFRHGVLFGSSSILYLNFMFSLVYFHSNFR